MKASPAIQLIMKAAANASVRKVLNLNPWAGGIEIKKKLTMKLPRHSASTKTL